MLSIAPSNPQKCTPNLLPTALQHNGPLPQTRRYWTQRTDPDTKTQHAYFRGRHLHGMSVPLPENYTGAVLHVTDKVEIERQNNSEEAEEEGEEKFEVKVAEQIGEFENVVVWEHGDVVAEGDAFVRGLREMAGFAEAVHRDDDDEEEKDGVGDKKTT
ncbi:hypothetical protein BS50DRAFT_578130 [Corynespora cassiicola Philippines]|uniref:Uncharacterized protein n=1 Tax=Corynespora cassiicola Philippines TaxID=1448308 RepID=A0A2T2NAQ5_CORCC|nr:hypothetical protein BS50DRAFT_578130 [Corynespora cassiicola Philippines]